MQAQTFWHHNTNNMDGAFGNGMQAIGDCIASYNNYQSGNDGTALFDAGCAAAEGYTAYGEGCAGDYS